MPVQKKIPAKTVKLIDSTLEAIIDQWYLSVSDYYLTPEKKAENPDLEGSEELKRFHEETGHRIKFNKGDLNFTYGLSVISGPDGCILEASVNNKVPNFNYNELVRRLSAFYEVARNKPIEEFPHPKGARNGDLFALEEDLQHSITVEQREGKADIVRLAFTVEEQYLEELMADAPNFMEVIHRYCVAPLRRLYAEVYRLKRR